MWLMVCRLRQRSSAPTPDRTETYDSSSSRFLINSTSLFVALLYE
jgi:hypothetical protein